jgi:UDP-N-acetylmuramoyl-L-alanyl-D-glutamate--2,6-diaminopimelate ligase
VRPGDLYAALPGATHHGARFCAQAVSAGAAAILTDPAGKELAIRSGLPVFVVGDPRSRLGEIASWIYGQPSGKLSLIGVTGTSGKTTTTFLLESGLRAAGHLTGLIGGVQTRIGDVTADSALTTPEATDVQALLAAMAEQGVTAAAMEVSSHALALGRVAGTSYDVAVFTNLSQDHLDFHETIDAYFAAKATLFTPGYARAGVVNIDDDHGRRLAAAPQIPLTTYSAAGNPAADWRATDVRGGADGSSFRVVGPGGVEADASVALPGPFNVANALAAIVALVEAGRISPCSSTTRTSPARSGPCSRPCARSRWETSRSCSAVAATGTAPSAR